MGCQAGIDQRGADWLRAGDGNLDEFFALLTSWHAKYFVVAVLIGALRNVVFAVRWEATLGISGIRVLFPTLIKFYFMERIVGFFALAFIAWLALLVGISMGGSGRRRPRSEQPGNKVRDNEGNVRGFHGSSTKRLSSGARHECAGVYAGGVLVVTGQHLECTYRKGQS